MSTGQTFLVDATPATPWKNGGGVTRELVVGPDARGWQWRVSVADIDVDGPFSPFPGVVRWFAVLSGHGVTLESPRGPQRIGPQDDALRFDGAEAPGCRLVDGPTRDLNLMLRGVDGRLERVEPGAPWAPQAARCGLLSTRAGRCDGADLPALALHWFERAPAALSFTATGWWIAVGNA